LHRPGLDSGSLPRN